MNDFKEKWNTWKTAAVNLLNREKQYVKRAKKRPLLLWILTIVSACAIGFGTLYYEAYAKKRQESYRQVYESLYLTFAEGMPTVFEYSPGSIDLSQYASDHNGTLTVQPSSLDLHKIGAIDAVYTISETDQYGQKVTREYEKAFRVEDNQPPLITLSEAPVLSPGEAFEPGAFILSVEDPVDGALQYAESEPQNPGNGWYTVVHNVDTGTIGSYTLTVTACDRSGNRAEASLQVLVADRLHEQVRASWQFSDHWYEADEIGLIGVNIETAPSTERCETMEDALIAYNALPKAILGDGCEAFRGSWYRCSSCQTLDDMYYIVRGMDEQGTVHYYRIVYNYTEHGEGYVNPENGKWTFTDWFID